MPTRVFDELDQVKKDRITEVSIEEFGTCGFEQASTNRIVRECGISKGSLFKYFENKEDLYFYLIDLTAAKMAADTDRQLRALSADLFERIIEYSMIEISWYIDNPAMGRLMIGFAAEKDGVLKDKIMCRYGRKAEGIYEGLLKGVDMKKFNHKRSEIASVLKWVLTGCNEEFLKKAYAEGADAEKMKKSYKKELMRYLDILKTGL